MSMKDRTAAELATILEAVRDFPHSTGGMSQLDEATSRFRGTSPQYDEAQAAFSQARMAHKLSYTEATGHSDEAWNAAVAAAEQLANLLHLLGDRRPS